MRLAVVRLREDRVEQPERQAVLGEDPSHRDRHVGDGAVARLAESLAATHVKRPTLYYALRQLKDRGLLHTIPSYGTPRLQAEPLEKLLAMIDLRHAELNALAEEFREWIPKLEKSSRPQEGVPVVTFYQGEAAMKQIVMETLYASSRHIDSIAPKDNFFWQVGQVFSQRYIAERLARKITTRNLWEEPLKPEILARSYRGVSEIRLLPQILHGRFRSTVFLYDQSVMYISSLQSGYVLLVTSKEHAELMHAMYDGLWEISKPMREKTP